MKTQMRFQKIFMIVSLVIAALVIVYGVIFCSGTFFQIHQDMIVYNAVQDIENVSGARALFYATQGVSNTLLTLGIIAVLIMALGFIMGNAKRRNYYITNYIATGLAVVFNIVVAIIIIVLLINVNTAIAGINWDIAAEAFNDIYPDQWHYSTWTIPVGYVLAVILVLDACGLGLNLLWKIKLMQGEKKLLEQGLVKEVA